MRSDRVIRPLLVVLGLAHAASATVVAQDPQIAFASPDSSTDDQLEITDLKQSIPITAQYGESCTPTTLSLINGTDICLAADNCEYHFDLTGNCAMTILPSTVPTDPNRENCTSMTYISTVQLGPKALNFGTKQPYRLTNSTVYERCTQVACISNWPREFETTIKSRWGWWDTKGKIYGYAESVQHPLWEVRDAFGNATRESAALVQQRYPRQPTASRHSSSLFSNDHNDIRNTDNDQDQDTMNPSQQVSYTGPDWYQTSTFLRCSRPGRPDKWDFQQSLRVHFETDYMRSEPHNGCGDYGGLLGRLRARWGSRITGVLGDVVALSCA